MICGVIFDLDGVLVKTDDMHYKAWSQVADKEDIYFDKDINDRLRGVSRLESLDIILEKRRKEYTQQEKINLAEYKNDLYRKYLSQLDCSDILPGVDAVLADLKKRGLKTAIGSSSKNADYIIEKIGLAGAFDAVVSGTEITKTKPDPEVFVLAARELGLPPEQCVVVEDAKAGIQAAKAAGMKAIGVGNKQMLDQADDVVSGLDEIDIVELLLR